MKLSIQSRRCISELSLAYFSKSESKNYNLSVTFRSEIPMKMERSYKKVIIISVVGIIVMIIGITMGAVWSSIYNMIFLNVSLNNINFAIVKREGQVLNLYIFTQILTLTPSSVSYGMWQETPVPMYLKFYMFNWTNPHEFNATTNVEPNFVEMGPYVFR